MLDSFHLQKEPFGRFHCIGIFHAIAEYPGPFALLLRLSNRHHRIAEAHCPTLTKLSLQPSWRRVQTNTVDANAFLRAFVREDDDVTCPHLEYFALDGPFDFSFETLCRFIEAKRRGITTSNAIRPWRRVAIDLSGITDMGVRQQMSSLFLPKP